MMLRAQISGLILVSFVTQLEAAPLQSDENFIVMVAQQSNSDEQFAARLRKRANHYRALIAREWLGEELPGGIGRTTIHVELTSEQDKGLTWARASRSDRTMHNVFLQTSRERAISTTLAHEVAHVVLATEFPDPQRLAPWVEEGIASQYDDAERKNEREKVLRWIVRSGNWPSLKEIMQRESISTHDRTSYTVASSVTKWLVAKKDKATFVRFAKEARNRGWDAALQHNYELDGIAELEREWRQAQSRSNSQ